MCLRVDIATAVYHHSLVMWIEQELHSSGLSHMHSAIESSESTTRSVGTRCAKGTSTAGTGIPVVWSLTCLSAYHATPEYMRSITGSRT